MQVLELCSRVDVHRSEDSCFGEIADCTVAISQVVVDGFGLPSQAKGDVGFVDSCLGKGDGSCNSS